MKYITFNDGNKIPQLGLGTFLVAEGESAYDTVLEALKIGYRHIDTAQSYGNEESIGKAIIDSKIKREEIFITTKLKFQEGTKEEVINNIESSFKKLQTNYIDLLLIHWPAPDKLINQSTWKIFENYKQNGKVKSIGVSNFQIHHLNDLLETAKVIPVINQVELHPGLSQASLMNYLKSKSIAIESYGPFMKGQVFEGKFNELLSKIADSKKASVAQVVIAWGLQKGIVMIPKSVTPSRLLSNFQSQDVTLSDAEIKEIDSLNAGRRVYTDPDNNTLWKKR